MAIKMKKANKNFQNVIYQFHYTENLLAEP